jgi:hypothetical protein
LWASVLPSLHPYPHVAGLPFLFSPTPSSEATHHCTHASFYNLYATILNESKTLVSFHTMTQNEPFIQNVYLKVSVLDISLNTISYAASAQFI